MALHFQIFAICFFIFCLIGKVFIFLINLEDFHLKVHSMMLRLDQVNTDF